MFLYWPLYGILIFIQVISLENDKINIILYLTLKLKYCKKTNIIIQIVNLTSSFIEDNFILILKLATIG